MPFIVLGLSHRSSPVTVRERFAFSDAALPQALEKLRRAAAAAEAVILSTCNRVEIYAVMEPPEREAAALLRQFPSIPPAALPRFGGTAANLVQVNPVGRSTHLPRAALRERAETAFV